MASRMQPAGNRLQEQPCSPGQRAGEEASGLTERQSEEKVLCHDRLSGTVVPADGWALRQQSSTSTIRVMWESLPVGILNDAWDPVRDNNTEVFTEHQIRRLDHRSAQSGPRVTRVMLGEKTEVLDACMQNAPVLSEVPALVRKSQTKDEDDICKQISLLHRKPRRKKP